MTDEQYKTIMEQLDAVERTVRNGHSGCATYIILFIVFAMALKTGAC